MSPAPHPRMHGLTHVPGGSDPIPGLLAASGGATGIWAGGHGPTDSGAGAQTVVACPIAMAPSDVGSVPLGSKFYTGSETPDATGTHTGNIGLGFRALTLPAALTGIQFYRAAANPDGPATFRLWQAGTEGGPPALVFTADTVDGWNELFLPSPFDLSSIGVSWWLVWYCDTETRAQKVPPGWTRSAGTIAESYSHLAGNHGVRAAGADPADPPFTVTTDDYMIGPIVNATPVPSTGFLWVTATAAEGTDPDVHVIRTSYDVGVITIEWSAPNATVAVHVHAIAT